MECRDTGEFAHRETTDYEQYETYNDEVCNWDILYMYIYIYCM
jgi:hypothetical protein